MEAQLARGACTAVRLPGAGRQSGTPRAVRAGGRGAYFDATMFGYEVKPYVIAFLRSDRGCMAMGDKA